MPVPRPLRPRPGNLRDIAEQIEEATGLRVQVLGGSLVMSPTPRGKHAGTIRRLRLQLEPTLPSRFGAYEVTSVGMPDDPDDYATPDLVVLPDRWDEDDAWLADPADAVLAVEVIPQSEKARDIRQKNDWYAVAGVASLLVIDPRHGTWALHTRPGGGAYQERSGGKYGEGIPLPEPRGLVVATDAFPRYGTGAVA
ncbi:Uma2 family endonuclease [Streptomyces sp. NPDC050529]|uniref:Uma2 family endonuclease n=1 Tax=unclassified Streptomyces TaxID=2593676 RepID=UPI002DDB241D|nr:Uma2 family endonuclease [Streptomyces sp. NBC_01022]WRZ83217.1 Uma2 family endonuclease [Streptomyces sp. NBC_01022]